MTVKGDSKNLFNLQNKFPNLSELIIEPYEKFNKKEAYIEIKENPKSNINKFKLFTPKKFYCQSYKK